MPAYNNKGVKMFNIGEMVALDVALDDNQRALLTSREEFKQAATPEDGAAVFTKVVDLIQKAAIWEQSRVERVGTAVTFLEPEGDVQTAAVRLARNAMGLEGPRM